MIRLWRTQRGSAALEFALVFPVFLMFTFGLFATYSLISCKRAMEYGIEKALRAGVTNSSGGATAVTSAYATAAGKIWPSVGSGSSVSASFSSATGTNILSVTATYTWTAPAGLNGALSNSIFNAVTLSAGGSMRVAN